MDWERFGDAGVGPSYYEAREAMLGWAWPQGIITGTSGTTIDPMGTITRAEVATMLARFDRNVLGGVLPTAPSDPSDASSDGYTLANGKPITEENVQEILQSLRETYPSGSHYPSPYHAISYESPYGMGAMNCAGWAALCSDAIFGILPCRRISNPSWEQIRVGDLIEYDTEISGHVVVVVKRTDEYFTLRTCIHKRNKQW